MKRTELKLKDGSMPKIHSYNYSTTVENFQILSNNRGRETGYDKKRVNGIIELLLSSLFLWLLSTIKVLYRPQTKSLIVLDGANRITAVKKLIEMGKLPANYQIPFTVVNDPVLNKMSNKDLIDFMSVINEYDPRWKESEHYSAAISSKLETALMFEKYLTIYNSMRENLRYDVDGKPIKPELKYNVLLAMATKKPIESGRTKVRYRDFRNDQIAQYMRTNDFENDFNSLIEFIDIAKEWHKVLNIRLSKSLAAVLSLVYNPNISIAFPYMVSKLKATKKIPKSEREIKTFLTTVAHS
jgi:hypothetical protein